MLTLRKKQVTHFILILVILILFVLILQLGPIKSLTWETYSNKQYGFEFRYPKDFPFSTQCPYPLSSDRIHQIFEVCGPSQYLYSSAGHLLIIPQPNLSASHFYSSSTFSKQPDSIETLISEYQKLKEAHARPGTNYESAENSTPQGTDAYNQDIQRFITYSGENGVKIGSSEYWFYQAPYFYEFVGGDKIKGLLEDTPSPLPDIVKTFRFIN